MSIRQCQLRRLGTTLLVFSWALPSLGALAFREVSATLGLGPSHRSGALYGPGIASVDYDLDGDLDVYLIDDQLGNRLLRNDGGLLVDVAPQIGLALRPDGITEPQNPDVEDIGGMMPCFVDIDNDGDRDFYLTIWRQPARMFRNVGGIFEEFAPSNWALSGRSATASFGDYNRDGWLDFYVCDWGEPGHLFQNGSGLGFSDVSSSSGIWDIALPAQPAWSALWFHHDADAAPELLVAMDYGYPNLLYWNLGASFLERSAQWFQPGENAGASMGLALGDFDHDGDDDLYVANTGGNDFYRRQGESYNNLFATGDPIWSVLKEKKVGWFVDWIDLDNDGWLDLFLVNGYIPLCTPGIPNFPYGCDPPTTWRQPDRLWHNQGGTFLDVGVAAGVADPDFGRGAARADYDLDGDVDLMVTNNNGPTRFYWNESSNLGHWVTIRLRGTLSNRDAIGTRIFASAGGLTQQRQLAATAGYLSQPADELHIGIGAAAQLDSLRIVWPSGLVERYFDVPADRRIELSEGAASSVDSRLPTPPSVLARSVQEGVQLSVELGEGGFDRARIHKVRPDRWSGVVADLVVTGPLVSWLDAAAIEGESTRYLVEARLSGNWMMSDAVTITHLAPLTLVRPRLPRAVPNPFNPGTMIHYETPGPGSRHVVLAIHDLAGRRRRTLVDAVLAEGPRFCEFDGKDAEGHQLGSGVYFARLSVEGFESVARKITLLR